MSERGDERTDRRQDGEEAAVDAGGGEPRKRHGDALADGSGTRHGVPDAGAEADERGEEGGAA